MSGNGKDIVIAIIGALALSFVLSALGLLFLHMGWPEVTYFEPTLRRIVCLWLAIFCFTFKL